jgi:hypothetical protein
MRHNNRGFTLIELITVFVVIFIIAVVIWGGVITVICKGNFWYSEDSVLKQLKNDHPDITEVLRTERHVVSDSIITVRENGIARNYCLDTDVLWNYEFVNCTS